MNEKFWTTQNISGILLLLGILIILAGIGLVAIQGKLGGLAAGFMGVEEIEDASGLRVAAIVAVPGLILQLLGFGLLAILLKEAGDHALSSLAFNLLIVSLVLGAIEGTFQGSVTVWAAQEAARSGSVPEFYEPLREWVNSAVQPVYVITNHVSMAGYGWAILRTGLLARWVGWLSIGWSLLGLLGYVVGYGRLPAVLIIYPLVIGIALLVRR